MITLRDGTEVTEDEFYSWSSRKQRGQLIGISDEQKVKLSAAHLGKNLRLSIRQISPLPRQIERVRLRGMKRLQRQNVVSHLAILPRPTW